jgi:alkylated DNA repair protein (DNA oxidative demethylase)
MTQPDLFGTPEFEREGVSLLRGFAMPDAEALVAAIEAVAADAPFRHMTVPGGGRMSVAMTNAGIGWVADTKGYRYAREDPLSGQPWPDLPPVFLDLARRAARAARFEFTPDGCLINRYEPGAKMGLHQDINEGDYSAPIVSVSLGLPATFQFGGLKRSDPVKKITLHHGDIVVWGGASRKSFHGVLTLKAGHHAIGAQRCNLTFRKAL